MPADTPCRLILAQHARTAPASKPASTGAHRPLRPRGRISCALRATFITCKACNFYGIIMSQEQGVTKMAIIIVKNLTHLSVFNKHAINMTFPLNEMTESKIKELKKNKKISRRTYEKITKALKSTETGIFA